MKNKTFIFESKGESETKAFGERLGKTLSEGQVVALIGELGAGKTTFVKGIVKGLGVLGKRAVKSPTFALVHRYEGRMPIYHFDAYRLMGAQDMLDIGCEEMFFGPNVSLVEWANNVLECLPSEYLQITLMPVSEDHRKIELFSHGKSYEKIVATIQSQDSNVSTKSE